MKQITYFQFISAPENGWHEKVSALTPTNRQGKRNKTKRSLWEVWLFEDKFKIRFLIAYERLNIYAVM